MIVFLFKPELIIVNVSEFRRELTESLTNALRESSAAENVVLEINASRHAYNISMEDVLITVTQVRIISIFTSSMLLMFCQS